MNLLISPLLLFLLLGWLELRVLVAASTSSTGSSTFYCGQTPCKPPGHCCDVYKTSCCTFIISSTSWSQFLGASTTSSTFYCGQTPCKSPGHCCGDYKASCCTSTSSGTSWYIYLIVALVVVGVGVGVGVGIYFWRKRGGSLPYVRST